MFTIQQVATWFKEEADKARSVGIPVSKDIEPEIELCKARTFYAQCCRKNEKHPNYKYYIRFSEYFLYCENENYIRETLMHEALHTCPSCMNHGKEWQKWVKKANDKFGYHISRISTYEDFSLRKQAEKVRPRAASGTSIRHGYLIECSRCGAGWARTRRSRVTENIGKCKCPYCKDYTLTVRTLIRI